MAQLECLRCPSLVFANLLEHSGGLCVYAAIESRRGRGRTWAQNVLLAKQHVPSKACSRRTLSAHTRPAITLVVGVTDVEPSAAPDLPPYTSARVRCCVRNASLQQAQTRSHSQLSQALSRQYSVRTERFHLVFMLAASSGERCLAGREHSCCSRLSRLTRGLECRQEQTGRLHQLLGQHLTLPCDHCSVQHTRPTALQLQSKAHVQLLPGGHCRWSFSKQPAAVLPHNEPKPDRASSQTGRLTPGSGRRQQTASAHPG